MAAYSFSFLPLDYARCLGEGCRQRKHCARHSQIERDKEVDGLIVSYTATLIDRETDSCDMRIEKI